MGVPCEGLRGVNLYVTRGAHTQVPSHARRARALELAATSCFRARHAHQC
jgi:hypothetical protein